MSTQKQEVVITCNTKQPVAAVRAMESELKKLKATYQQLSDSGKAGTERAKKMAHDIKELSIAVKEGKDNMDRIVKVTNNLSNASLSQLNRALRQVKNEMGKVSANSPKLNDLKNKYQQITDQINTLNGKLGVTTGHINKQGAAWKTTLKNLTTYFSLFRLFSMVQQKLTAVFRLNLKFSDQLADIRKVSGLAMQDINRLSENLAKLDTRTTIEELNQIAYAGAKLGIGKYGTEGLEQFVRAANQVNVALKEDLGADALTALSKITEVMGLIPKMGVEKSMLAVGSAMFQLSATSTATSNNIVEFAKRLTGMARTAGITTDQLLALGSASDSMYLMPEVASTAFNKLISSLQTKHNLIENELQIKPGTINELYSAGRAIDAIVLIFEKMREKGNMNALQGVFKDLGSDGARLVNVMVTMSKNVDMLKDHLYTSQEAFEEATAVSQEYAIQQETAQALMERASNIWEKAFVNPEGVDMVKEMAEQWYNLSQNLTQSNIFMGEMKAALFAVTSGFRILLAILPMLVQFLLFKGVASAFLGMQNALKGVVLWFNAWRGSITTVTAALQGLNAATKANIIGGVISLVSTLVFWLVEWGKKNEEVEASQKDLNTYLNEAAANLDKEKRKLDSYLAVLSDANTSADERRRILNKFNKEYRPYLTKLGVEVNSVGQLKEAYFLLNEEIKKKMYYQMKEKAYDDKLGKASAGVSSSVMDYSKYIKASDTWSAFDSKWLQSQVDSGLNAETIYRNMVESVYGSKGTWSNYNGDYIVGQGMNTSSVRDNKLRALISNFIKANKNYKSEKKIIDDAFDPIIGDYNPFNEETPGVLDKEAPDKDAIKAAKEEARKQKEAWRKDLEDAQDLARAIIDNIKNFYQRQITEVLKTAKEQNWDTALTESVVRAVEGRMNLALSQARKSIAGVENSWDDFKKTMETDLKEKADEVGYNESQVLLDKINATNTKKLHDFIAKLSANLGLPGNAATDAIWKNASLNEKANETAEQKRRKEVQKRLLDDNYTAKVDNEYTQSMETLGFFDLDEEQTAILLGKDVEKAKKMLAERDVEIKKVFENARTNIVQILNSDVQTSKGYVSFMEAIFGKGWDQEKSHLKEVFNLYGDDLQAFYNELIKYSDSYTEALKKSRERQKKILDEMWMKTDFFHQNEDKQKDMETFSSGVSQYDYRIQKRKENGEYIPRKDTYGTGSFISSMGFDPEVESYRLKMEAAEAYYKFLKEHQADAETLRDAEQGILRSEMEYAKSVAEQMKQRMNDMYALAEPIEDFGTSVGEAFATMTEDSEAGRKAMKAAIGDMIKSFMRQTIEMTKEYAKRSIMQKMNDRLTSTKMKKSADQMVRLESSKQNQITQTQEQGGQAQKFLNERVQGDIQKATAKIGQETLQEHKANVIEEVNMESAKTQANTSMGIASGASIIIGSRGWWGIPLVAVITSLLNGLLSFAMSKVSSLFGGGGDTSADAGPNVKLVTGMLTYDSGNVQAFRGVMDGQTYPVVGNDGNVYAAKDGGELSTGLVRDPITTLINGQPALVAERGPEMVIGRETTAAMMMARPDLLTEIVKFDRYRSGMTYRAYDSGNVQDFFSSAAAQPIGLSPEDVASLRASLDGFAAVMALIQRNGLHVNKFGRGSVTEEAASGAAFMRLNSGDRRWKIR